MIPGYYSEKRAALNKPKYIPLDVLVHFLETANSFQEKLSIQRLQEFAQYFELNDSIRRLCLIDNQTELSGALIDDIYRQNPDSRRSLVELISNSMDAEANRILVDVSNGSYKIKDNGCGMTADILFNKLFIPKSSSKLVIADSIGRFGVGFYTALAHLKDESASVVIRTHSAKERDGYQISFRYRDGRIEVSIETHADIPIGTEIIVKDKQIKTQAYVDYVTHYFGSYPGDGLFVNGEAIKLSDNYERYPTPQASALINQSDGKSPSITLTLANVLISEMKLPAKSNALSVIWRLPKDTTITESRDAVQVDSIRLVQTIKDLIHVVYALPQDVRLAYLNTISAAVQELQSRNSFYGIENNIHLYLMNTLIQVVGRRLMVPDGRQYDFLDAGDCVRVHSGIIPENWLDDLGFQPKEWQSHQVTAFVVKAMAKDNHIFFDDINKTLYITEALYLKAKTTPSQLSRITQMLLRDNAGAWQFKESESKHFRAADIYNFSDYSPPKHHALYLQHGGLTHVDPMVLDEINPQNREILGAAKTLVAKYPFKGQLKQRYSWTTENEFDTSLYGGFYTFEHQGVSYFVSSQKWKRWENTVVYDENFHPVSGKRGELILSLFRDSTEVILPAVAKVERVIMKKGEKTQLVCLDTDAVLLDGLPLYSYYQAIPESSYYIIRTKPASSDYNKGSEEILDKYFTNYIYNSKNQCIRTYKAGKINVIPWQGLYLVFLYGTSGFADFYASVDLCDAQFNSLSSALLSGFYGEVTPDHIKSFKFHDETLIVIQSYSTAEVLKLNGDQLEHFSSAILVGEHLDKMIIDNQLYQLDNGSLHYLGRVKAFKHSDKIRYHTKQDIPTIQTTFVVYETDDLQIKLLTPDGQHWMLPEHVDYQDISKCCTNRSFIGIRQGDRYLLMKKEASDSNNALLVCEELTLIDSASGGFALVDGYRLINSKGVEVFNNTEQMKVKSDPDCPYLILRKEDERGNGEPSHYLVIDSDGNYIFPTPLRYAGFGERKHGWRVVCENSDSQFSLSESGLIVTQGETSCCFEDNYPYFYYPEQAIHFFPKDIEKIATNTYLVPGSRNEHTRPPYFYKQIPDRLLGDKDVLANLNYLNQRDLNNEDYSNALRFVDCPHEVFVAFYPFLSQMTYTPTREQFNVYYEYYKLIFSENRSFLKKAIRLIDVIYFAAGNNTDIELGSKIIDIVKLYGVSVLSQLYDAYSQKYLELYRVLSVDNEMDTFLAPLPKKPRELSYYLFSKQTSLLNELPFVSLADEGQGGSYCSLLDAITVANLRTQDLVTLQTPEELCLLISEFDKTIDTDLAKRKLIHATYHLCDVSTPNYMREMIQNAMDASAKGLPIKIDLYQTSGGRHVTRVEDKGCGMDLYTVLHSLVIPGNSTKRGHQEFIGGRGVGFFSAFHGAESITLKTSKGDGTTCYFNFIPIYDESNDRIIDVKLSGRTVREDFTGTTIDRVSRADNGTLEAARTLNAVRQFGRFVDAGQYKILLNGNQINESLSYIGEIHIDSLGACKIYSNSECAFTSGGLFIKTIDEDYWDAIPDFIASRLKAFGIVIELPASVALTRERNNFYAADKFKDFFKPLFFQLCLNAYCNLLKQGKIEANYLPDDLFRNLRAGYVKPGEVEAEIIADAEKVNRGQLFESYARYLSNDNCVFLLTHIQFISYGDTLVSLADIARLNQTSKLNTYQLPDFVTWRLDKEAQAVAFQSEYERNITDPKNEYEKELVRFKYCSWTLNGNGAFQNAPNWALFYKLCTQISAAVADKYGFELEIRFSTRMPSALAFVVPAEFNKTVKDGKQIKQTSIFINPFNWQRQLESVFKNEPSSHDIRNFINELFDTLAHEIAHIKEESFCTSGVMTVTHHESFRGLNATVFSDLMLQIDTEQLAEQVAKEINSFYKESNDKVTLPNAKELMIMQIFNKPDYLAYLEAEREKESVKEDNPDTLRM
ncbi:ATP-binding protein [Legionella shakespearei]|uniref:DNA mismatch repair protein MutL n=1 Tax=Legionella shakespearei DSM 23087 TaxID=1122169 RepID=A0A0W0YM64_9GAMM|nr:ATP-binding protein [Legionella shakespearei]KTD57812.1 DNA mismatch repair protein MutL [Legionella shakespearei DSM 23087]